MKREETAKLALAIALTAIAGCVDAIGFLKLGHLFVSFMSGDSTQMSVSAAHRSMKQVSEAARIVVLFVAGVVIGNIIGWLFEKWCRPAVLLVETLLLLVALMLAASDTVTIILIVLAMGIQNAAVRKAGDVQTNLTYVTGTLVHMGEKLAQALTSMDARQRWGWVPYLLLWSGLVIGAIIGAAAYDAWKTRALALPASATALLTIVSAYPLLPFRSVSRRGQ